MKISYNWLSQYIDVGNIDIETLSSILTTVGLEVENIAKVENIKGGLNDIVVGRVISCEKHPNADRLKVAKVDIGTTDLLNIVCGAPNIKENINVLVATIGATLFDDNKAWRIKKGKIRGVESHGMICSESELGIGSNHDGIAILEDRFTPGTLAATIYDTASDYIFDIGLTPNRSDATSHIGVAKDIAAYLNVHKKAQINVRIPEIPNFTNSTNTKPIQVEIKDIVGCPRYSGITLSNIAIGESPRWIQTRLKSIGVKTINNVVDITNFVLHEFGQPLHAFDYDSIEKNKIVVANASRDLHFCTLDEKTISLNENDLMIYDGNLNGLCLAGIFGGKSSGITNSTTTIFLESAHFNASKIRKSSTNYLLRTDAAKVFEKGSDPNVTVVALRRAVQLLIKYANATVDSEIIDIYPVPILEKEITVNFDYLKKMIGQNLGDTKIIEILKALGMQTQIQGKDGLIVKVPTNKADVVRNVDLLEEILRIYGYNNIDIPSEINSIITKGNQHVESKMRNTIASFLMAKGFNESMTLSLTESKFYQSNNLYDNTKFVYINNTSNVHLNILRPEMMMSSLISIEQNYKRQKRDLWLFEFGNAYFNEKENENQEIEYLTITLTGKQNIENWLNRNSTNVSFFDIKTIIHSVLNKIGIHAFDLSEIDDPRYEYGLQYNIGKNVIAKYGLVSKSIATFFDIEQEVYFAEIPLQNILFTAISNTLKIKPLSKYPKVKRDLSLIVDKSVKYQQIKEIAFVVNSKILKEVSLFDVYKNDDQLGSDKKSYAVSYIFEDLNKTLKDSEIDKIMNKMIDKYSKELNAIIRS